MERRAANSNRKQDNISVGRRKVLIDEVMRRNQSINSSAKKLGIKYSTAKLIIKRFKETGTIIVRNIKKTYSIGLSEPSHRLESPETINNQIENEEQIEALPEAPGPQQHPLEPQDNSVYLHQYQSSPSMGYSIQSWLIPQVMFFNIVWH